MVSLGWPGRPGLARRAALFQVQRVLFLLLPGQSAIISRIEQQVRACKIRLCRDETHELAQAARLAARDGRQRASSLGKLLSCLPRSCLAHTLARVSRL